MMNDPDFVYDDIKDRALIDRDPAALKIWNAAQERARVRREKSDSQKVKPPRWTVHYNIVSPESDTWVGRGWEFFDEEKDAEVCYKRQIEAGNVPSMRPYHDGVDRQHLGAVHQHQLNLAHPTPPPSPPPPPLPSPGPELVTESDPGFNALLVVLVIAYIGTMVAMFVWLLWG